MWILTTRLWELDFCRSNHDAFTLVVVLCWRRIFDAILNLCFLSSIRLLLASQPGEIMCRSEYLPVWNSKTCVFYTSKRFFFFFKKMFRLERRSTYFVLFFPRSCENSKISKAKEIVRLLNGLLLIFCFFLQIGRYFMFFFCARHTHMFFSTEYICITYPLHWDNLCTT